MYQSLADAIDRAAGDPLVRCILLQAEGDAFTAGNDLGDFAAVNRLASSADSPRPTNPLLTALARATTPIVAAVQGRAVGIGTTMLLHCDLVLLSLYDVLTSDFVYL